MKRRLWLGLGFAFVLIVVTLVLHVLLHPTIYTNQSYATARIAVFGVCLALLIFSWPRLYSAKFSLAIFAVWVAELIIYFRPVPIDSSGIGEAVPSFLPFWLSVSLVNLILIPAAIGLVGYAYLHDEKRFYVTLAAIYLVLLATLFPFEQICRWAQYALM